MGEIPFRMTIEDTFFIKGHGVVVVGHMNDGDLRKGDKIRLRSSDNASFVAKVSAIKVWHKENDQKIIDILLKDVPPEQIAIGMTITTEN